MGRSERKIASREIVKPREELGKPDKKTQAKPRARNTRPTEKKEEISEQEDILSAEKRRPLKKALDQSVKEAEKQANQKKQEGEKENVLEKKKGKRGRPRKEKTEGTITNPQKKRSTKKKDRPLEKIKTPKLPRASANLVLVGEAAKEKKKNSRVKKVQVLEEVLNDPLKKDQIKRRIESLDIEGRREEIKQITEYIVDSTRHTVYIYGKPGTGKTYVMERIGNLLGEEKVEVYYSNLLIDKSFRKVEKSTDPSKTAILIVDEFEGPKKNKLFIRQKEKLERQFRREERPKYSFKVFFISNEYNSKGVHFRPYEKDSVKQIVEATNEERSEITEILKIDEGVEKKDLRASMTKKIESLGIGKGESFGQYHKFIKERIDQGKTDVNCIYSEFLQVMKENGIPVMPKEVIQEIIEGYADGTI